MACAELSRIDTSQIVKKAAVIENRAAELYGNQAEPYGFFSTASHTEAEPIVSTVARIRPTKPPTTAPRVVQFYHSTDMKSTEKLPEQAIVKASITM